MANGLVQNIFRAMIKNPVPAALIGIAVAGMGYVSGVTIYNEFIFKDPNPVIEELVAVGDLDNNSVADLAQTKTWYRTAWLRPGANGVGRCYKTTAILGEQQGDSTEYLPVGDMAKKFPWKADFYSKLEKAVDAQSPRPKC